MAMLRHWAKRVSQQEESTPGTGSRRAKKESQHAKARFRMGALLAEPKPPKMHEILIRLQSQIREILAVAMLL
jgi:hypothetical protein